MTSPRFIADATVMALFGVIWLGIVVLLRRRKKSLAYLTFFTIFYVYLFKVLDYTLFQYQSLLVLKHLMPGIRLNGLAAGDSLNLVPLVTLTSADLQTSLLNILMLAPFGFGLPFITGLRMKGVVVAGFLFSLAIEILQFSTGLVANVTFRVADINDVIFNTTGAAIGYVAFAGFARLYRGLAPDRSAGMDPISRHIIERPQIGG